MVFKQFDPLNHPKLFVLLVGPSFGVLELPESSLN